MACEASKRRRADKRLMASKILRNKGIRYSTNNFGVHLVIFREKFTIDFWPGTGKFTVRGTKRYSNGIFNMINLIKQKEESNEKSN